MKTRKTTKSTNGSNGSSAKFDEANTLHHLFEENLRDIYDAEQQLINALPDLINGVDSEELKDALNKHLEETKRQAERAEKIFTRLNVEKGGVTCEAMQGLITEARGVLDEFSEGPVRDAALIIAIQKIEHYEIATYGSLCELADVLGMSKTCEILERTLNEEEAADRLLTGIAMDVNDEACEVSARELVY